MLSLQEDVFELKALDIGKLLSITVGHSSVGRGRGWFCAGVRLSIGHSTNQLLFPCDRLVASAQLLIFFVSSSRIIRNRFRGPTL